MSRNRIDPSARLIGDVQLGADNVIEAGAIIIGPIQIGDGNYFGPYCVIGAPPEDDFLSAEIREGGLQSASGFVSIGDRNVLREFVTVHRGLTAVTEIGDDCYVMSHSHVAHDCSLRDRVKVATSVTIAGYCWIGRGAYLGLSSSIRQFGVIGGHAMIGMGSVVTRPTGIASLVHGNPARAVRPNGPALERLGVAETGWWAALQDGQQDAAVPDELAADLAEFSEAVDCSARLQGEVAAWRAARRSASGGQ